MPNSIAKGWEEKLTQADIDADNANGGASGSITIAPEEPVQLVKDPDTGQVTKVIYGDIDRMMEGDPVVMWTEEIVRDDKGVVIGIQTMRPNGTMTMEHMIRDDKGKFLGTKLEFL